MKLPQFITAIPNDLKIAFGVCIAIAALSHGFGMFHYPYYEGDEGIYTSQAWSLVKEGTLSPYLYWYDHPPFGWITMAAWTLLFGGNFFIFGDSSIDNMRVFMLLVHIISAACVFFISYKLSKKKTIAVVATLLFTLSPLFIYYQRRVLIDNVLTMWLLLSYALLLSRGLTTKKIIFSGVLFGFALLTKIPAIVFLPAFLYTLWLGNFQDAEAVKLSVKEQSKRFAVWLLAIFCIGMVFIGYTIAQGEFLPPSVTGGDHVSFISGIQFQLSRDSQIPFWQEGSYFTNAINDWLRVDRFTIFVLTAGIIAGLVAAWKNVIIRSVMAFVVLYLIFLMRGSIVTNFYILPLVPFAAIATALSVWWLTEKYITKEKALKWYVAGFSVLALIFVFVSSKNPYVADETSNSKQSIAWIKENIDEDKTIMADMQGLVDLWDTDYVNTKSFRESADWFSKVVNDYNTRELKLENNYKNIDYVLSSHELLRQMKNVSDDSIAKQALLSAGPIKDYAAGAAHVDESIYKSDIGNWARLFQVDNTTSLTLDKIWKTYKQDYVHSYGQIIDPQGEISTSKSQAFGMMQALIAHDQAMFDGLWLWTKNQFQFRGDDTLLSSEWVQGSQTISDNNTFADATIAAALILASKQWHGSSNGEVYKQEAQTILNDLWRKAVVTIDSKHYMLASDQYSDIHTQEYYILNVASLVPVWYELFAQFDLENPWGELAENSYQILSEYGYPQSSGQEAIALELNRSTASLVPHVVADDTTKRLLYQGDLYQSIWLAALSDQWFSSPSAKQYLEQVDAVGLQTAAEEYDSTQNNSTAPLAAYLAYLTRFDQQKAMQFYQSNLTDLYDTQRNAWGQSDTSYSAQWMWLGAVFYEQLIPTP